MKRISFVMELRPRKPIAGPCPYCGRPLKHDIWSVACKHSFHQGCLIAMALESNKCCVCQRILTRKARRERIARERPADVVQPDSVQASAVQADVVQADVVQADVGPARNIVISDLEEQPKQDGADGQIVVELMAETTTALRRVIDLQNLIEAH
jgi:hypothetical protein